MYKDAELEKDVSVGWRSTDLLVRALSASARTSDMGGSTEYLAESPRKDAHPYTYWNHAEEVASYRCKTRSGAARL